jgi:DNA topoisomerase-3
VREVVGAIRSTPRLPPTSAAPRPAPAPAAPPRVEKRAVEKPVAAPPAEKPPLPCPRCQTGALITGKRGWGCSRWREGCSFVIWFETAGKRLTETQLEDLITKGKTRKAKFGEAQGRLVLDLAAEKGGARFVSE